MELVNDDGREILGPEQTKSEITTSEVPTPGSSATAAVREKAQEAPAHENVPMATTAENRPAASARDNPLYAAQQIEITVSQPSQHKEQPVRRGIFAGFNPGILSDRERIRGETSPERGEHSPKLEVSAPAKPVDDRRTLVFAAIQKHARIVEDIFEMGDAKLY